MSAGRDRPLPRPRRLDHDQLRDITAPTLLLLPHVEVEIIPDAGHGIAFQYPELIARKVGDHLRRAERPT